MATTSPDNLWSPDTGDGYDLTIDTAAMQATVQTALTSVRNGNRYFVGTDAARIAATGTAQTGDRWAVNNVTPRREYFYTGTGWILDFIPRTTFTPSWVNFVPGTSAVTGTYSVSGGRCEGNVKVVIGTGFAFNTNGVRFNPPLTSLLADLDSVGTAVYLDAGSAWYHGTIMQWSDGTFALASHPGATLGFPNATGTPFGWNVNDAITFNFAYPVS